VNVTFCDVFAIFVNIGNESEKIGKLTKSIKSAFMSICDEKNGTCDVFKTIVWHKNGAILGLI
jgi:hypothetical protein